MIVVEFVEEQIRTRIAQVLASVMLLTVLLHKVKYSFFFSLLKYWILICNTKAFYVSTNGSVSGTGSFANPFGNITDAILMASYGDTITLMAGTYTLSAPINPMGKAITIQVTFYFSTSIFYSNPILNYSSLITIFLMQQF